MTRTPDVPTSAQYVRDRGLMLGAAILSVLTTVIGAYMFMSVWTGWIFSEQSSRQYDLHFIQSLTLFLFLLVPPLISFILAIRGLRAKHPRRGLFLLVCIVEAALIFLILATSGWLLVDALLQFMKNAV